MSDVSKELHDGDGGALTEDEGSTDQSHDAPNCEEDSGEKKILKHRFLIIFLITFKQQQQKSYSSPSILCNLTFGDTLAQLFNLRLYTLFPRGLATQ